MSANASQDMFDRVANQNTWDSPSTSGLLNVVANMFGAQSIEDLPPFFQTVAQMLVFAGVNNYGDQLGIMNQGNMFANMHQAVLASGPIESRGLAGADGKNPYLGTTTGPGAKSVQMADILTRIAAKNYFNEDGSTNDDATQGMSGQMYTGYAAGVMKERGIQPGDILTAVAPDKGAKALYDTASKAVAQGASQDSDQYKSMIDIARVTERREELMSQHKEYATLRQKEEELRKYDSMDPSKMTDAQKQAREAAEKDVKVLRSRIDRDVDSQLEGTTLEGKTINGKKEEALTVTKDMVDASRQQENVGGSQFELVKSQTEKDIKEALRRGAKNVAELEKMWGTHEFADLQKAAKELAMGSLADKDNVEKVAARIKDAQIMSEKTGRSIQSIWKEQSDIVTNLANAYGGKQFVDQEAVTTIQRQSEQAAQNNEKYGYGPDKTTMAAELQAQQEAYLNDTAEIIDAEAMLNDPRIQMTSEQRQKMQALVDKFNDPNTTLEEQEEIRAQMHEHVSEITHGEGVSEDYHKRAMSKYGNQAVQQRSRAVQGDKQRNYIADELNRTGAEQMYGVTDENREDVQNKLNSVLFEANQGELEELDKLAKEGKTEEIEGYIKRQVESSGLTGEAKKRYEDALRGYSGLTQEQRNIAINYKRMQYGEHGEMQTVADQNRAAYENAQRQLDDVVAPPEQIQKEGMAGFLEGILSGGEKVTNRDAVFKQLNDKKYINEEGEITEEQMKRLNKEEEDMGVLQFNKETRALENTDVLEKTIDVNGQKVPMWKAMGLGETLDEAKENAKDPQKMLKAVNELKKSGYSFEGVGNGKAIISRTDKTEAVRNTMEQERIANRKAKGLPETETAQQQQQGGQTAGEGVQQPGAATQPGVDMGVIPGAGGTGQSGQQPSVIQQETDKLLENGFSPAAQNKAKNAADNAGFGGYYKKDVAAEDTLEDEWDDDENVRKAAGTRDNYTYQRAIREAMVNTVEELSDEKDKSGKSEKERYWDAAKKYMDEHRSDYAPMTDEDWKEFRDDHISDGLNVEELSHVLMENPEITKRGSEADEYMQTVQGAQKGLKPGQKIKVKVDGKEKELSTDEILKGETNAVKFGNTSTAVAQGGGGGGMGGQVGTLSLKADQVVLDAARIGGEKKEGGGKDAEDVKEFNTRQAAMAGIAGLDTETDVDTLRKQWQEYMAEGVESQKDVQGDSKEWTERHSQKNFVGEGFAASGEQTRKELEQLFGSKQGGSASQKEIQDDSKRLADRHTARNAGIEREHLSTKEAREQLEQYAAAGAASQKTLAEDNKAFAERHVQRNFAGSDIMERQNPLNWPENPGGNDAITEKKNRENVHNRLRNIAGTGLDTSEDIEKFFKEDAGKGGIKEPIAEKKPEEHQIDRYLAVEREKTGAGAEMNRKEVANLMANRVILDTQKLETVMDKPPTLGIGGTPDKRALMMEGAKPAKDEVSAEKAIQGIANRDAGNVSKERLAAEKGPNNSMQLGKQQDAAGGSKRDSVATLLGQLLGCVKGDVIQVKEV